MHENQSPVPLPRYRCHKVVEAAKIDSVMFTLVDYGVPDAERQTSHWLHLVGVKDPLPVTAEWYDRHKVQPGGYFVRYADGYTSFSPAAAFEEGYAPVGATAAADADPWKVAALVTEIAELRRECDELRRECAARTSSTARCSSMPSGS